MLVQKLQDWLFDITRGIIQKTQEETGINIWQSAVVQLQKRVLLSCRVIINSFLRVYVTDYGTPSPKLRTKLQSSAREGVYKSFRTGRPERELQMVQLPATRCSCIAILWVSLVSFAAKTLFVASQRGLIV